MAILGKCIAKPRIRCQEVGQDNSSEEAHEQCSENRVVSNTAERVERSVLTKEKVELSRRDYDTEHSNIVSGIGSAICSGINVGVFDSM